MLQTFRDLLMGRKSEIADGSSKRLLLHVGSRKTGSTAIQYFLGSQPLPGATYLKRGRDNSSLWMAHSFQPGFPVHQVKAAQFTLRRAMAASPGPLDILSAENISTFKEEPTEALAQFCRRYYREIDIFIYFRPLKSMVESAFQERLKHGRFDLEQKFQLQYWRRVELLDEVFGQEHVHIFKFDPGNFPHRDVVAHFLEEAGYGEHYRPVGSSSSNTGLCRGAVQMLYIYRQRYTERGRPDKAIVRALGALQGESLRFHSELFERVLAVNKQRMSRFEERAGFLLTEDIYAHDASGIRGEEDMYALSEDALDWLATTALVSKSLAAEIRAGSPEAIADGVRALAATDSPTVN